MFHSITTGLRSINNRLFSIIFFQLLLAKLGSPWKVKALFNTTVSSFQLIEEILYCAEMACCILLEIDI